MKTAISIPDLLFEAAERVALRLGISRSELYRRALKKFLEDRSYQVIRERLDEVYGSGSDDGRLDPAIEYAQRESLPEDDW
jgi:metal-responsive CopG/Arc/MetJ family transcriptional regulator